MWKTKTTNLFPVFIFLAGIFARPVIAEAPWHFQAGLEIAKMGLAETILPAGLFYGMEGEGDAIDLQLIGPDGQPRSFELYWKEDNESRQIDLEPGRIYLDQVKGLVWEALLPENFILESVRIDLSNPESMGKLDLEARKGSRWQWLARNAVLYQKGGQTTAGLQVKAGIYQQLRLCFKGYDKTLKETAWMVQAVRVQGRNLAKDYALEQIKLHFADEKTGNERVLSALLPGSDLVVQGLTLKTEARFQGIWRLGYETVPGGIPEFHELLKGEVSTIKGAAANLEIRIDRSWPGRSLILKLDPGKRYLGNIMDFTLQVRLPRLVFQADKPGLYWAQAGLGNKSLVKKRTGESKPQTTQAPVFAEVMENPLWRPENLIEQFGIGGGPFHPKGYRWKAKVTIPAPGYYRLVLNQTASFEPHPTALRLVKDRMQIPFFKGRSEARSVPLQVVTNYDQLKNNSSWIISFPKASPQWEVLHLEAQGIFERHVVFEIPKTGAGAWATWRELNWQNRSQGIAVMQIGLQSLPAGTEKVRVTMQHGDNRPIELQQIKAFYRAPSLLFIAQAAGEYSLFGGRPDTPEPRYDLALVQAHLTDSQPAYVELGEWELLSSSFSGWRMREMFGDRRWGLYAVLGLVTLVLLVLIVRLFPKEKKKDEHAESVNTPAPY